jgi:hypothetical protein
MAPRCRGGVSSVLRLGTPTSAPMTRPTFARRSIAAPNAS